MGILTGARNIAPLGGLMMRHDWWKIRWRWAFLNVDFHRLGPAGRAVIVRCQRRQKVIPGRHIRPGETKRILRSGARQAISPDAKAVGAAKEFHRCDVTIEIA